MQDAQKDDVTHTKSSRGDDSIRFDSSQVKIKVKSGHQLLTFSYSVNTSLFLSFHINFFIPPLCAPLCDLLPLHPFAWTPNYLYIHTRA